MKKKEPDARCQLLLLGRNMKARRCTNPACGWDAHHRRACREHMPAKLLPAEVKTPNVELSGQHRPRKGNDER